MLTCNGAFMQNITQRLDFLANICIERVYASLRALPHTRAGRLISSFFRNGPQRIEARLNQAKLKGQAFLEKIQTYRVGRYIVSSVQAYLKEIKTQNESQTLIRRLLKLFWVLTLLFVMPNAWMGILGLLTYASIKTIVKIWLARSIIFSYLVFFRDIVKEIFKNPSQEFGKYSFILLKKLAFLQNYLFHMAISVLFIVMEMTFFWNLIAFYGVRSITSEEWINRAKKIFIAFISYMVGFVKPILRPFTLNQKMLLIVGMVALLSMGISISSWLYLAQWALYFVSWVFCIIGFSAIIQDTWYNFKHPLVGLTTHMGKLHGILYGYEFAHYFFRGQVNGSMGPAYGVVTNDGIAKGLISFIFSPNGKFSVGYYAGIFTSILTTYNMHMMGDFAGSIGPTTTQILLCMVSGGLIGYAIEGIAQVITDNMIGDVEAANKTPTAVKVKKACYEICQEGLVSFSTYRRRTLACVGASLGSLMLSYASNPILLGMGYMGLGAITICAPVGAYYGGKYALRKFKAVFFSNGEEEVKNMPTDNNSLRAPARLPLPSPPIIFSSIADRVTPYLAPPVVMTGTRAANLNEGAGMKVSSQF